MSDAEDDLPADAEDAEAWTFHKIGEFVFWFSQAEVALRFAVSDALGLPPELIDPVTASYDFRTLCSVARVVCCSQCDDPAEKAQIGELIKRCLEVNDTRVRIVHGTWNPNQDGGAPQAFHMSRQSMKVTHYFSDHHEIADAVKKCKRLAGDLIFFPGGAVGPFSASLSG
jgi:hypothetical protein